MSTERTTTETTPAITKDWWVDGHFIAAATAEDARAEAASLYGYQPETVRPWDERADR